MDLARTALVLARSQPHLAVLKNFGAMGNGINDDTSAFGNAPAGVTLVMPGSYVVSGNIFANGQIFNGWGAKMVTPNNSLVYSSTSYGFDALGNEQGTQSSNPSYTGRNAGFGTHALSQNTSGYHNVGVGWGAGQQITTGSQNTLLGMAAGNALTTGVSNVAVGTSALLNLTTGGNNVAIGRAAGLAATTANYNVLIGRDTAEAKQTGDADTLVGYEALWTATATGGYNTALGWRTFFSATGTFGTQNTTVGSESSYNLTTGGNNVAIGQRALFSGTTVSDTVAIGQQALYNLTTGARNTGLGTRVAGYTGGLTTGNDNVLIGWQAYYGGSGTANVIIGSQTVGQGSAATGSSNVVVGEASGVAMTAGGQNTILGGSAGTTLTTGNGNVLIGYNAQAPAAGNNGQIVIAANGSNIVTYDGSANFNINATSTIASGGLLSKGAGGVGYTTGAGGTVTQATSRTTGVTLNKAAGQITLFSAAGSATPVSFTVSNSTVAAADVVHISQASGTNPYGVMVTAVAAGSFTVTFWALSGTATDAPVFNFAVIKGSAA